ncbi:MAG TPA: hypothetical protein VIV40_06635 [Kofleriaceae bacterium]
MIEVVTLRRRLFYGVAIVALLGLVVEVWHARSPGELVEALLPKLSLSYEGNLPTWWSSSLLLASAIAAGAIARERPAWHRHWWGITAMLAWMSLDEAAELHEHLAGLVGTSGVLYFDWVIPAAVVVALVAVIYWPFVRALAPTTRTRLIVAAAIYIAGALVMELPLGWWTEQHGNEGLTYGLIDWVEETMEMIGASLALVAFIAHRQESRGA